MSSQPSLFPLAALVLLAAASVEPLVAQTATALQTSELVTGARKQCYYSLLGGRYTRTVPRDQLCPMSIQVPSGPTNVPTQRTVLMTRQEVTGSTKQCLYVFAGVEFTRTVLWHRLCPQSIKIPGWQRDPR